MYVYIYIHMTDWKNMRTGMLLVICVCAPEVLLLRCQLCRRVTALCHLLRSRDFTTHPIMQAPAHTREGTRNRSLERPRPTEARNSASFL